MKTIILSILALLIFSLKSFSQVDVQATSGILAGTYPNLTNAFIAINNGTHTGDIVITVNANTTNNFIQLNYSGSGFTHYTSIKIVPGAPGPINIDNAGGGPLFWFNSVDNLTIDGTLPGGFGPLTFRAPISSSGTALLHFFNDTQNDTVRNCSILGNSGYCIAITNPSTEKGNKNLIFSGNEIANYSSSAFPQYGIYSTGSSDSIIISGNYFHDIILQGNTCSSVYLQGTGAANWKIKNNHVYYSLPFSLAGTTQIYGIYSLGISNTCEITGNIIGYSDTSKNLPATITSSAGASFIGINTNSTQYGTIIRNNVIDGFDFATSTFPGLMGSWCGIMFAPGYDSYIDSNRIGKTTGSSSIRITHNNGVAFATGMYFVNGVGNIYVRNNSFGSIEVSASTNNVISKFFAININTQSTYNIQNNIIGDSSTKADPTSISVGTLTSFASSIFAGLNIEANSFPTVNMNNNIVRNCRARTNSDSSLAYGIKTNGTSAVFNALDNKILDLQAISSSTGSSRVYGVFHYNSNYFLHTIKRNQINNLSSLCGTGSRSGATGIFAYSGNPSSVTDSNIVHDIITNSSLPGIAGGAIGIQSYSNTACNKIYNIINTNATVNNIYAIGLFANGADTRRNLVYDIKTQTSNNSIIEGIRFTGVLLIANVISLGTGITTNPVIKAVNDSSFQQKTIAFNSAYIGGTQSANLVNTAALCLNLQNTTQIYNNIFYNARSSTGLPGFQSGRHYALKANLNSFGNIILSYNNLAADNNGGMMAASSSTEFSTITDFKNYTYGNGAYCFSSNPQYNNPESSPPDLTLPMNNKQSNGGARLNSFFSTDFNGNTRSIPSTNRPDMGAFEADYGDPAIDLQEPYIFYSPLPQDLSSAPKRELTNFVWMSDNKSLSNTNPPRVYYKTQADPNDNLPVATNTSADPMGWRYGSGTTSDGGAERYYSFVIDYSKMNPGTSLIGDTTRIQYFVTAEDNAGNFRSQVYGALPGTPSVNVTSAPLLTDVNFYFLRKGVQGTYYIKAGGLPMFDSFRAFSAYYTSGIITGDITLILGGDIYGNDELLIYDSFNNNDGKYKITLRPDGNTVRTFQNADTTNTYDNISLSNIKNLTIDGSDPNTGTGKYLRFINNADEPNQTGAIINFGQNTKGNIIRNCILESNGNSEGIVNFSNSFGPTGADSNTISNCDFRPSSGTYAGRYQSGVYFQNTGTFDSACSNNKIDSCDFLDFYGYCINVNKAAANENMTITHNKFHLSWNYGTFFAPIRFQAFGTNLIADNEIYNSYTNQAVWGIYVSEAQNTTIARNKINLAPTSTPNAVYGIYLSSFGTFNTINIVNNQIKIEPTGASTQPIMGIYDAGSQTNINMLYNTIYIGGQSTGTTNTYCVMRENPFFNSSSWNCQNNIFYNNRTPFSETAQHYSIGNRNVDYGLFSNYNFFVGKSTSFFDDLFFENRGTAMTLQTWRFQSSNRDATSLAKISNTMNVNNFFQNVSDCNLSVRTNYPDAYYVNGMGYPATNPPVSNDFNGNPRSSSITTGSSDIGAFEITPSVEPSPVILNGPFNIGTQYFFYLNDRYYGSIVFNTAVQPSSLALYYYSGVNPPNAINSFGNSYFRIVPSGTSTGLDYDLRLAFDERELNNITAPALTNLAIAKSEDDGTTWTYIPGSMYDNTGGFASAIVHNQTSFSLFSFTGIDSPLPVELAEFNSTVNRNDVSLKWTTISEKNSARFEIERKISLTDNWNKIGSVNAAGTTGVPTNYTYDDRRVNTGKYKYRLKQIDMNGTFKYYDLRTEVEVGLPKEFRMSQNYPNPFNPTSKIDYELPFDSKVEIRIYDMTGREMNVLVNQQQQAGYYTVQFNGGGLSSGTYFYRIAAKSSSGKDFSKTLKMVLVK
jgi:hypothetical protein